MPQLDLFSYPSIIIIFCVLFVVFFLSSILSLQSLGLATLLGRLALGLQETKASFYEVVILLTLVNQFLSREFFLYAQLVSLNSAISSEV